MTSGFARFQQLMQSIVKNPMEAIVPLAIFGATFLACWVVRRLVLRALTAWSKRSGSRTGALLFEAMRGPTLSWALILAVHLALQGSELPSRFTQWESNILLVLWIAPQNL